MEKQLEHNREKNDNYEHKQKEHSRMDLENEIKEGHKTEHNWYKDKNKENSVGRSLWVLLIIAVAIISFNQFQINGVSAAVSTNLNYGPKDISLTNGGLDNIDISSLKSTGHTIAAVFPVDQIKTAEDAMTIMFPTGTPDYGETLGVSFDDPVASLDTLSKMYRGLKAEVERNNPEGFKRFMNLASKPVGISCEYCCGVGPIGIDNKGNSACGCQHNPALLSVAMYLSAYTDYSDGQILREVMKWKTLFFPKNMIELGASLAGGDVSSLKELPGMVGGC